MFCVLKPLQTLYVNAIPTVRMAAMLALILAKRRGDAQTSEVLNHKSTFEIKVTYLGWQCTFSLENNPECQMYWYTAE